MIKSPHTAPYQVCNTYARPMYLSRSVNIVSVRLCLDRDDKISVDDRRVILSVPLSLAVAEATDSLFASITLVTPSRFPKPGSKIKWTGTGDGQSSRNNSKEIIHEACPGA